MGPDHFAKSVVEAGIDGVIIVNLPPEEALDIQPVFLAAGLDLIFLIAPTTTEMRTRSIVSAARGFIYYVSLKGVTGARHVEVEAVREGGRGVQSRRQRPGLVGFGLFRCPGGAGLGSLPGGPG